MPVSETVPRNAEVITMELMLISASILQMLLAVTFPPIPSKLTVAEEKGTLRHAVPLVVLDQLFGSLHSAEVDFTIQKNALEGQATFAA